MSDAQTESSATETESSDSPAEPVVKLTMGQSLAFFGLCNDLGFGNIDYLAVETVDNYGTLFVVVHRRVGPIGRYRLPSVGGHERVEDVLAPPPLTAVLPETATPSGPYNDEMLEGVPGET